VKTLQQLLQGIDTLSVSGDTRTPVTGVRYDSRSVQPGDLFVCIKGYAADGHDFIDDAVKRGAQTLVLERDIEVSAPVVKVVLRNTRQALGKLACNFFDDPSSRLFLVGITGTNGKTTTTFLARAVLSQVVQKVGLIGTIANMIGDESFVADRTTPEAVDVIEFLNQMLLQGAGAAVMEVSSHAVSLDRLSGLKFDCGVFTNLTREHLDFHGTLENYLDAKGRFFSRLDAKSNRLPLAAINIDDTSGAKIAQYVPASIPLVTYGMTEEADVQGSNVALSAKGTSFLISYQGHSYPVNLKLCGAFNVYNSLAAFCVGLAYDMEPSEIILGLESVASVPGRFEAVDVGQDFLVIVDYAHTPDGLLNVLQLACALVKSRLILVFGCGGDRDRTKRPVMGEIALQYSDYTILTSDNPRTEEPIEIINEIENGLLHAGGTYGVDYEVDSDRRDAIHRAIKMAGTGDVVLICGKGHETYQIIGTTKHDFDDRKIAREVLEEVLSCAR
jgi:UDP-N-acetylmuramoyl-L-alanyl-D-glutamate--2,6-diaminopimelate ligase